MFLLNKVNFEKIIGQSYPLNIKKHYFCSVFFMVLDLRFRKIGSRETSFFFLFSPHATVETRHATSLLQIFQKPENKKRD